MIPVFVLGCCAAVLIGCRSDESFCPRPTVEVDPAQIPTGDNETAVTVTVHDPNPDLGRDVLTELYAISGTFDDPDELETTYTCAHDVVGEVEVCVDVVYGPAPGNTSEAIASAIEYLRAPHAYFVSPEDCLETRCTTVLCPGEKNECPVISTFTVEPEVIMGGQSATVRVAAEDPDANPAPLVTTLQAIAGTFGDRHARETTYRCAPEIGGPVEVCLEASDGDNNCDVSRCLTVQCPGASPENVCPVIRDLSLTEDTIPRGERQTTVIVDAFDPDAVNPEPLVTRLSASTGTFNDRNASTAVYTCGAPGQAEICVEASDGDRGCDRDRCTTVQCPSTVPDNLCPKLYVLNAIPSNLIPEGQTSTEIQVRAQDGDRGPLPLMTTLSASRGSFDDVHASDTFYHCERSGQADVCVDATDGACVKTLCMDVFCPAQ